MRYSGDEIWRGIFVFAWILLLAGTMAVVPAGAIRRTWASETALEHEDSSQPVSTRDSSTSLRMVGQVGGRTEAVAVQGNYAYVAVGLRLVVLDGIGRVGTHHAGGGRQHQAVSRVRDGRGRQRRHGLRDGWDGGTAARGHN